MGALPFILHSEPQLDIFYTHFFQFIRLLLFLIILNLVRLRFLFFVLKFGVKLFTLGLEFIVTYVIIQ